MNTINVRVYVAIVKEKKVFALFEKYAGASLLKFPGGGLEYGEGTIECLQREMDEELNLQLKNVQHFYTQEDFVVSRFRENEQLLTIYYTAEIVDESAFFIKDKSIEKVDWISLEVENPFTLPVDRIVFEKLNDIY